MRRRSVTDSNAMASTGMHVLVGAAIDYEAPHSMTFFLEIPLNGVGVVKLRGPFGRSLRHLLLSRQCMLSRTVTAECSHDCETL